MAQITIKFDNSGRAVLETTGMAGSSCMGASAPFESTLGKVVSVEKTEEFYAENTAKDKVVESETDNVLYNQVEG